MCNKKNTGKFDGAAKVEDARLWQEFCSGNKTAYETIYKINTPILYHYGLKLVKDKDMIKDAIQDLFVEIWDRKHKLAKVKSIKSYLYKSLRRKLISESTKRRATTNITADSNTPTYASPSAEQSLIGKQELNQQRIALKKAMEKLTDRQREIVHLKYYARLSYEEIAEVMSLSKKGAYKLMGRAIHFLKKHIE